MSKKNGVNTTLENIDPEQPCYSPNRWNEPRPPSEVVTSIETLGAVRLSIGEGIDLEDLIPEKAKNSLLPVTVSVDDVCEGDDEIYIHFMCTRVSPNLAYEKELAEYKVRRADCDLKVAVYAEWTRQRKAWLEAKSALDDQEKLLKLRIELAALERRLGVTNA